MKFEMHKDSLFAMLLRQGWWVSALLAAGVFGGLRIFVPWEFAAFSVSPFAAIAAYLGWKALRTPGAGRVAAALGRIVAMSREDFTAALEAGWRREGYEVARAAGGAQVDLELRRGGRLSLVGCRRWKAVRTGVEPLRELHEAAQGREAQELVYVAAGEVTEQARVFAQESGIRIVSGAALAALARS
jgi:restriction system protein